MRDEVSALPVGEREERLASRYGLRIGDMRRKGDKRSTRTGKGKSGHIERYDTDPEHRLNMQASGFAREISSMTASHPASYCDI